jgi:hypothetical protein
VGLHCSIVPDPEFLGLPDPALFLRIQILPSPSKKSKKTLDFYCFVTSLMTFLFLKTAVNVPTVRNKQKKLKEGYFLLAS